MSMLKVCRVTKGQIPGNWELYFSQRVLAHPQNGKKKLHQLNPHAASQATIFAHCKNASGVSNAPQMLCCWLFLAKSELKGLHALSASK